MAYLRVKDLCERLNISDTNDHIQKLVIDLKYFFIFI